MKHIKRVYFEQHDVRATTWNFQWFNSLKVRTCQSLCQIVQVLSSGYTLWCQLWFYVSCSTWSFHIVDPSWTWQISLTNTVCLDSFEVEVIFLPPFWRCIQSQGLNTKKNEASSEIDIKLRTFNLMNPKGFLLVQWKVCNQSQDSETWRSKGVVTCLKCEPSVLWARDSSDWQLLEFVCI